MIKYKDSILNLYKKYNNMKKVSIELKIPANLVKEVLDRNEIKLNYHNQIGHKLSEATKNKISNSNMSNLPKVKVCKLCNNEFEPLVVGSRVKYCTSCKEKFYELKKLEIPKDKLYELYITNDKSISFIAEYFNCSNRTIYSRIKEYNITLKRQN